MTALALAHGSDNPSVMPHIPGYRISRVIGHGGMSTVYLGTQLSLMREVAIKIMRADVLTDEVSRRRFENEARTIARLEHPHIVSIYEVGRTAGGQPWYSMPYLGRGHLGQRDLTCDHVRVRQILEALLSALAFVHARGVIHRDIKAENILFDENDRPLLADFGIALRRGHGTRVTLTGLAIGSTAYMAPEQVRGQQVDHRTDLYGLGVLAWEMLTGQLPYQAGDAVAMAVAHVQMPLPRLPPGLRYWQRFMDRALAKLPHKRFHDAEHMQSALRAIGAQRSRWRWLADSGVDLLHAQRARVWAAAGAVVGVLALGLFLSMARTPDIGTGEHTANTSLVLLADAGIEVTPVCDLISITDPQWQPALEAYLGSHIDALLVPEARELDAIGLYKEHKQARSIFRVKLALPSRGKVWQARSGGAFAAQLIAGDNTAAVRYLQGELGQLSLADSAEQLRAGHKAISSDGMLSSGGGIERLRLSARDELLIGRSDSEARRGRAQVAYDAASARAAHAEAERKQIAPVEQCLAPFANIETTYPQLEHLFTAAAAEQRELSELHQALIASQSDQLAELSAHFEAASRQLADAEAVEAGLIRLQTELHTRLGSARERIADIIQRQELAAADEGRTRQQPLYDANEVQRHRQRYDERHAIHKAETAAQNHEREAWEKFSFYLRDFQLQNTDIAGHQWLRAHAFILEDKQHLEESELADQQARSQAAYEAAVKVFRTDVAQTLLEGFEAIEEQIGGLNEVLKHAPEFSNGERYRFKYAPVEPHRALYEFLKRVREYGGGEDDMFGGAGQVPEEFRALIEGDASSGLLHETSPLSDHRRFFSYDVEILSQNKPIGLLSKRLGPGSGGEHRTPLYVIFGAALAAAYGKTRSAQTGGGIMLLDEAFEKMDAQNVRATADYLNALGLQLVMAGPEADQAKMSSFLNVYYDMARYGSRTVQLTKNVVLDEARELLQSDNYFLHPELMDAAMRQMAESGHATGG